MDDMDYDVLIVGSRVAGASLALLLGERGHRVLMIDRDAFPSDTLSTHFMARDGVVALERLGVLADVEAAGFRRITRTRTWVEDCLFEGPAGPPGAYSLAPRRDVLDTTLIRHAVERGGVEFQERTHAEGLIEENGLVVGAVLRSSGGASRRVRARWLVGADGKYSKIAEWVKAERYELLPTQRPGYYGYFHGFTPLPEATVELIFAHNQVGFVFPMRPGEDCLALELQPEDYEAFRANPRAAFEERFRALPGMAARMEGAQLEGKVQGTRGIENVLRQPYGPGWALTGDAGYLRDPITGTGIADTLTQSFLLADALDSALRGVDWEADMRVFQRKRDAAMLPGYRWTIASLQLRDAPPESLAWVRGALANPHLARQIMYWLPAALSGDLPSHLRPLMRTMSAFFGAEVQHQSQPAAVPASAATIAHD